MSDMKIRRAAIKKLEDKLGRVTAENLVAAASEKRHPLHNDFTWDNAKAGHQYRLDQARAIIVSIRPAVSDVSRKLCTAYVRDPSIPSQAQGYIAVAKLRTDHDAAHEALSNEAVQLQAQLDRMRGLATALDLVAELDAIIESAMVFSSRLRRAPAAAAGATGEARASA
jgi:hypothetical protein